VLGYVNVAALRQHIRSTERIHGIFTAGGDKPNIVPALARTEWMVRSGSIRTLAPLKERVEACLRAGADATGCEVEIVWKDVVYADMLDNEVMVGLYAANARQVGRDVLEPDASMAVVGSTDMGNVSYVVPSIHPMIQAAPTGVPIHTPEFAGHARGAPGDLAVLDGAVTLGCTIADLWLAEGALAAVRAEFDATIDRVGPEARRSAIGGGAET
jgi:metal-dependent amidase/aminoacylase/carboxypeptidase family protein